MAIKVPESELIELDNELYWVVKNVKILSEEFYIHTGVEHNLPKERYYNLYSCHSPYRKLRGMNEYFVDGFFAKDCFKVIATTNTSISTNYINEKQTLLDAFYKWKSINAALEINYSELYLFQGKRFTLKELFENWLIDGIFN